MKILKAISLSKIYQKKTIVKNVSVTVKQGEIVGLLGPNGAGKTTIFHMIVGLIKPDNGIIELNGNLITKLPIHVRAKYGIGYLPQESSIFRRMSVADNLLAVLETRTDLNKILRKEICNDLLSKFSLSHLYNNLAMTLSGGERRRLEIARSLIIEPNFILLDEPFAGIDPLSIRDIQKIIYILAKKRIGIFITDHNVRETLAICDRAYIIHSGIVLAKGNPKYLLTHPDVKDIYLGHDFKM